MDTAKLIESEDGQDVRLPEEYRFKGDEVRIRRQGNCVILEPVARTEKEQREWEEIFENLGEPFDEKMVEAALNRPGPDEFERLECDLELKD